MAHARDSIRLAVQALLANVPGLEDHICFDEPRITEEDKAPWCYVWLGDEDIAGITIGRPPKRQRSMQLTLDIVARGRFDIEQQCEAIGALIENLFDSKPTLNGLVKSLSQRSIAIERDSESPIIRYRMTYVVIYWTEAGTATATV
jgi:hypothetical protein